MCDVQAYRILAHEHFSRLDPLEYLQTNVCSQQYFQLHKMQNEDRHIHTERLLHVMIMTRYEDERLAEGRFAAFTDKKERKLLASDNRRKKMDTCLQKVRAARAPHGGEG